MSLKFIKPIFGCAIVVLFLYAALANHAAESNVPQSAPQSSSHSTHAFPFTDDTALEKDQVNIFTRRVPDQKVLFQWREGVPPPTILNLSGVFDNLEHLHLNGTTPEITLIDFGKKDVVTPNLEGETLTLEWRKIGRSTISIRAANPDNGRMVTERIKLEAWSPDYLTMFLTVFGGLGIFLLGMKNMSDGLQTVAGSGLQRMITFVTNNRFSAVAVGMIITMLIQSSSVTTVMVVGLINSQMMGLIQGIGVIMGANIGTTITAWIFALAIDKYGLPIAGVAVFFFLFVKSERIRYIAMSIMGLGLLFFGLQLMQQGFAVLRDLPEFTAWMGMFRADSYLGILRCAAVGCILTLIVQSSSATLAITISLAAMDVIPFDTAAALVLGENVGTTITIVLASIGTSVNSRRAAYFHVFFNLFGVLWVTAVFAQALPIVIWVTEQIPMLFGQEPEFNIRTGIAVTHSMFNIANTILFLPFVRIIARLLVKLVKEDSAQETKRRRLGSLPVRMFETPAISVERSRTEVLRMSSECLAMADGIRPVYTGNIPSTAAADALFEREEWVDTLQDEIIEFTSHLLSGNVSLDVSEQAQNQMRMASEYESIGDYLIVVLKSNLKLRESSLQIPEYLCNNMLELHDATRVLLEHVQTTFVTRRMRIDTLGFIRNEARAITARVKTIRNQFMERMTDERFDPQIIVAINAQLNAYRRVREHAENAAEAMTGVR